MLFIDAHNSFGDEVKTLDNDSIKKLRELVEKLSQERFSRYEEMGVGFARMVPSHLGLEEGVGAGGVSCIVFESAGRRAAVFVADANNASPWVRETLATICRRYGFVETELCTTDTHMVNGVSLGGRGYHPLGEAVNKKDIEEMFENLIQKALANISPAKAIFKSVEVENITVFSDFLEVVSPSVSFGIKAYTVLGFAGVLTAALLTYFTIL